MTERGEPTPALDDAVAANAGSAEVLEAIRELAARVGGLQADVNALRRQPTTLPPVDGGRDQLAWVRDLEGPTRRRPDVPWLLLEITFLAAVAVGAAVADLRPLVIVGLFVGAWALVALGELAGARAARRRAEAAYAPLAIYGQSRPPDPSWFAPPVERTVLDAGDDDTETRLPRTSEA